MSRFIAKMPILSIALAFNILMLGYARDAEILGGQYSEDRDRPYLVNVLKRSLNNDQTREDSWYKI